MVNKDTNVRFRETNIEAKKDDMWTGITGDETLLVAVKTTTSAGAIILVAVMGIRPTIIPGLKKIRLGVRGEVKERPAYTAIKLPLLSLAIVLVSTLTRPSAPRCTFMPCLLSHVPFTIVSHEKQEE